MRTENFELLKCGSTDLGVVAEGVLAMLTSNAAQLVAAEWHGRVEHIPGVDLQQAWYAL